MSDPMFLPFRPCYCLIKQYSQENTVTLGIKRFRAEDLHDA
jgi:hypothetical protein